MSRTLKQLLFNEYDGFADKRYKKIENDAPFTVDDRGRGDHDAKNELFLWFCMMFVRVVGNNMFELQLSRGVPLSDAVEDLIAKQGGTVHQGAYASRIAVMLTVNDAPFLREMAKAIDAIVMPGKHYAVKSYKYVCPRTAKSLRRLAELLEKNASTLAAAGPPKSAPSIPGPLL